MTLPLATTTITISRSDQDGTKDALDTLTYSDVVTGIRAVVSAPRGAETNTGGSEEDVTFRLDCDPTDLRHGDRVTDETTSETFEVVWTRRRIGLGLDHTVADVRKITDRAAF